jgi:hypothetical protein
MQAYWGMEQTNRTERQEDAMITCHCQNQHTTATLGQCEAWQCECGNRPDLDGFLRRDPEEPELGVDLITDDEMLCGTCGRVYDADGRERRQEAL